MYNSTTLVFTYLVRPDDHTPTGLFLYCDCEDYFQRTFIHLNNSYVRTGTAAHSKVYAASVVVAEGPSLAQRAFTSAFLGVIDNTPPVVTSVYANITVPATGLLGDPPVLLHPYIPLTCLTTIIYISPRNPTTGDPPSFLPSYISPSPTRTLPYSQQR